jgi:hypothetical protein
VLMTLTLLLLLWRLPTLLLPLRSAAPRER